MSKLMAKLMADASKQTSVLAGAADATCQEDETCSNTVKSMGVCHVGMLLCCPRDSSASSHKPQFVISTWKAQLGLSMLLCCLRDSLANSYRPQVVTSMRSACWAVDMHLDWTTALVPGVLSVPSETDTMHAGMRCNAQTQHIGGLVLISQASPTVCYQAKQDRTDTTGQVACYLEHFNPGMRGPLAQHVQQHAQ